MKRSASPARAVPIAGRAGDTVICVKRDFYGSVVRVGASKSEFTVKSIVYGDGVRGASLTRVYAERSLSSASPS